MIVAFSSLWFLSVTATPVPKNFDNDFHIQVKEVENLNT
jgi:hypothetical protein